MTKRSPAPEEAIRELIGRTLRQHNHCTSDHYPCADECSCTRVADAVIAALAAWNRRAASEREKVLEAALQPMAELAKYVDDDREWTDTPMLADNYILLRFHGDKYLTLEDCRKARAALAENPDG